MTTGNMGDKGGRLLFKDKLHVLVPSITEAMLSYVCQLSWPNSPRRTSVELNRCLVGDGRPLKGSWLTVETKLNKQINKKHKTHNQTP